MTDKLFHKITCRFLQRRDESKPLPHSVSTEDKVFLQTLLVSCVKFCFPDGVKKRNFKLENVIWLSVSLISL